VIDDPAFRNVWHHVVRDFLSESAPEIFWPRLKAYSIFFEPTQERSKIILNAIVHIKKYPSRDQV
jgi:hypothetical protein